MHGVRRTVSHAAIYSIGVVLQNITSLVMLPIYTRYLTPADYGTISMLQILIDVANLIFGMELANAVFRFYFATDSESERRTVIASALGFDVVFKGIGAIVLVLFAVPAAAFMFGDAQFSHYVRWFALALLTNTLFDVPFQYLRALGRPVAFVIASAAKLFVQLTLNIIFVISLEMHVMGVIYSILLTGAIVGGVLATWTLWRTRLSVSIAVIRRLLKFSIPLLGAGFAALYVTFVARWSLARFAGLEAVGLFALASRIVSMIESFVWVPFQQSWGAARFEIIKQPGGAQAYRRVFSGITLLLVAASLAASMLSEEFLRVMSAPMYWPAALLVPLIALVELIRHLISFSRLGLLVHGRTSEFFHATSAAAVVATIALFITVPALGVYGAPVAGIFYVLTQLFWLERPSLAQYEIVKLPWWKLVVLVVGATVAYGLSFFAPDGLVAGVLVKCAIAAAFTAICYYSPILDAEDREAIARLVRDASRKVLGRSQPKPV